MFELVPQRRVGKLVQMLGGTPKPPGPDELLVQTFRPPIPGSVKCTSKGELLAVLEHARAPSITIFTISSFALDEDVYRWLCICCARGSDVYLYTVEKRRAWYSDAVVRC
ncbi:hypothetical protein PAPHI01_1036 [Pancytospora philotis]|nr:hypothetical protein PAPHI01_1036 [Pancytospora philotis]